MGELLRDRSARASEHAFVIEGPRAVDAALDRGAPLDAVYLGPRAEQAFASLVARLRAAGVPIERLKDGVLERIGSTVTPQPVLAVAPKPRADRAVLHGNGLVLVAVEIGDPGNLGTILRSAEASGVHAIVIEAGSVDAYNPKVVRASAGAIFGVPLLEGWSVMDALDELRGAGRACYGTAASGGSRPDEVDLAAPAAVLLGNEARGLGTDVAARVDGWITIPMASPAESLNVAMAATVVCFEAARQRAVAGGAR
ncbi:MAG: TrmH family RNA methyltransferase [Acidimicrobiia bacterium]